MTRARNYGAHVFKMVYSLKWYWVLTHDTSLFLISLLLHLIIAFVELIPVISSLAPAFTCRDVSNVAFLFVVTFLCNVGYYLSSPALNCCVCLSGRHNVLLWSHAAHLSHMSLVIRRWFTYMVPRNGHQRGWGWQIISPLDKK